MPILVAPALPILTVQPLRLTKVERDNLLDYLTVAEQHMREQIDQRSLQQHAHINFVLVLERHILNIAALRAKIGAC